MAHIFRSDRRAAALAAVLLIALAAFAGAAAYAQDSDATSDPTYGTATDINIAPGMRYTWTSQWPSDLNPTCSIQLQKSGSLTGSDVNIASISGKTLTVNIPSNAAVGTTYHVVEKAVTTNPSQTAYVYIIFHVVAKLSVSVSAPNVVAGKAVSITPTASGMGTVTWSASDLPSWLSINASTGKITGTAPSSAANVSFTVTATSSYGETASHAVTFKVVSGLAPTNSPSAGTIIMPTGV